MAKGNTVSSSRREVRSAARPKRLRRVLVLIVLIGVVVVGWSAYSRYTDPRRIRAIAEAYLQQYALGRVTVGAAGFSWWEGVRLFDVTVSEVSANGAGIEPLESVGPKQPVFSCREIELVCSPLSTMFGRLEFESIVAHKPTCIIVRDASDGSTNLAGLLRPADGSEHGRFTSPPSIELRDARIRVVHRDGPRDRLVEDLELTVRGSAARRDSPFYDIVWHCGGGRVASGHSRIDLTTGGVRNVSGGLPWMSLEAVMIAVNARYEAAGAWCDLLGLDGKVRVQDYDFSPARQPGAARSATIELNNTSLSIPIDEQESAPGGLPPNNRYLRFDRVNGTIQVTADDLRAEFEALFHGSECQVSAALRGGVDDLTSLDDIDFDARIWLKRMELPQIGPDAPPEHVRFVNHWPPLARFFRDYDPHGPVDLDITAEKRAGPDEPIVIRRLALTAGGGDASCRYFPYRVSNLSGSVEYTPDGVFLRDLRGNHQGGTVQVDGWVERPNRCAAVELRITGRDVPIDDELCNSVPQRYKKIRDQFYPEGAVGVELILDRPACADGEQGKWRSRTTLTFDDLSARYVELPYPVEHLSGSLVIDRDEVQVVNVRGESGSAHIGIEGAVKFVPDRGTELDLAITAQEVSFDDALLSALPESVRGRLRAFDPTGRFDLASILATDPVMKRTVHTSYVVVHDATIAHQALPIRVEEVSAKLQITPDRVLIKNATGRYHGATVWATGTIDRTDGQFRPDVTIRCLDLRVDDELCLAVPGGLREVLAKWRVDGPISTDTTLRTDPKNPSGSPVARTVARLDGASVRHPMFPIPFTDVQAEITFDESGVRATGVEAQYAQARVSADFDTRKTDRGEEGTISLTVIGAAMDHTLRDILPDRLSTAWDGQAPHGVIDLHLDRLRYRRLDADKSPIWWVDGRVDLFGVGFHGVAKISGMAGALTVSGPLVDGLGGTALSGGLKISTVDLFGRRLNDMETPWSYTQVADGKGRFALDSVRGSACGGLLTGRFQLLFDTQRTRYNLSAAGQSMQIASLLNASGSGSDGNGKKANVRGVVDAHLYLSGEIGDPLSKRGGGRVEIRDGSLYRLPIMLAILNVINLSIPDENAFHDAEADFFILGNRVELEDIILKGKALALVGSGLMSLPDRGLDLNLVYVSPNRWARVPMLTDFVEWASRPLTELHITGPLFQPTVKARPFRGVSEEIKSLFQKRRPKKIEPPTS